MSRPNIADLVVKLKLELVGLTGFEHLKPAQISGGMKKRVGMARALALDPDLLFCDEPTAGLDPVMTAVIDTLTVDLTKKLGLSAVVVTHDMTSAFRIATQMIFLFEGKVLAAGTPDEIKNNPDPYPAAIHQRTRRRADPVQAFAEDDYFKRLIGP